eukprot:3621156-Amphidinium_carterae.1
MNAVLPLPMEGCSDERMYALAHTSLGPKRENWVTTSQIASHLKKGKTPESARAPKRPQTIRN